MSGFIETYYDGVCFHFWISKKGYCYQQSEKGKAKRISEAEYMSAYEHHHDL